MALVRVGVMAEGHGQHERHVVEPKQRIAHTDGQGERGIYDLVKRGGWENLTPLWEEDGGVLVDSSHQSPS